MVDLPEVLMDSYARLRPAFLETLSTATSARDSYNRESLPPYRALPEGWSVESRPPTYVSETPSYHTDPPSTPRLAGEGDHQDSQAQTASIQPIDLAESSTNNPPGASGSHGAPHNPAPSGSGPLPGALIKNRARRHADRGGSIPELYPRPMHRSPNRSESGPLRRPHQRRLGDGHDDSDLAQPQAGRVLGEQLTDAQAEDPAIVGEQEAQCTREAREFREGLERRARESRRQHFWKRVRDKAKTFGQGFKKFGKKVKALGKNKKGKD